MRLKDCSPVSDVCLVEAGGEVGGEVGGEIEGVHVRRERSRARLGVAQRTRE